MEPTIEQRESTKRKVSVVGGDFVGTLTARRIVEKDLADIIGGLRRSTEVIPETPKKLAV